MGRDRRARPRHPPVRACDRLLVRRRGRRPMIEPAVVREHETHVFVRELDRAYPLIDRGEGVWLYDRAGNAYLDAVGGGAMVASLGHGVTEIVDAARRQAARLSFVYNQQFTTELQERLADELTSLAPP